MTPTPENGVGTLNGRVALVTGASRGIGAATALRMGRAGAAVVLAARTMDPEGGRLEGSLSEVVDELGSTGSEAIAIACDLADTGQRTQLARQILQRFGRVDIVVNNAAAFGIARLADMSVDRFRLCFEVNVVAPFHLMQLLVPAMAERGAGWVVNITSDASRRPSPATSNSMMPGPGAAAYGGSKLVLEHLTRSVASEYASSGVAVNAVMPSLPVATPSVLAAMPGGLKKELPTDAFVDAVMALATCDARQTNGMVFYSEDLLHPELGVRGCLDEEV